MTIADSDAKNDGYDALFWFNFLLTFAHYTSLYLLAKLFRYLDKYSLLLL